MIFPTDAAPKPGVWVLWHKWPGQGWHRAVAVFTGTYEQCHEEMMRRVAASEAKECGDFYTAAEGRRP